MDNNTVSISRRREETILVGGSCRITVGKISAGRVLLHVTTDKTTTVARGDAVERVEPGREQAFPDGLPLLRIYGTPKQEQLTVVAN